MNTTKLRLLKLVIQPVFVFDDGESLHERTAEPFTITAGEIPGFPEAWAARFAELKASHEGPDPATATPIGALTSQEDTSDERD